MPGHVDSPCWSGSPQPCHGNIFLSISQADSRKLPDELMTMWKIGRDVGNLRNNRPDLRPVKDDCSTYKCGW
ncbi:MAG: hypothetical protein E5W89_15305 [Mesorhizobium sp.]|nr:MAG: hypothetical protein E5W89_15305 [Mesorhizobium sp.]